MSKQINLLNNCDGANMTTACDVNIVMGWVPKLLFVAFLTNVQNVYWKTNGVNQLSERNFEWFLTWKTTLNLFRMEENF